nr:3'-5' exonuclease [uncultured Marinifilum sp.]
MNICFIDFETTGIDVFKDNPIEFGAVLVNEENEIIKEFHSFLSLRTKRKFSAQSKAIHGLDESNLVDACKQKEMLVRFFDEFGTDYRFAGWNINFDVSFFRRMCHLNNFMREYNKIYHRHIDVQSISYFLSQKGILPDREKSLSDLVDLFDLERREKHSAIEDARLTFEVYKRLMAIK